MADTKAVVAPFSRPSDVTVVMDVRHPQPVQGLGNMLILNFVDSASSAQPAPNAKASGTGSQASGAGITAPADSDKLTDDEVLDGVLKKKVDKTTGALYREYASLDAVAKHGYAAANLVKNVKKDKEDVLLVKKNWQLI